MRRAMIARAANTTHAAAELVLRRLQSRSTAPCSGEPCSWAAVNGGRLLLERWGLKRDVAPQRVGANHILPSGSGGECNLDKHSCVMPGLPSPANLADPAIAPIQRHGPLSRDSSRKGSTFRHAEQTVKVERRDRPMRRPVQGGCEKMRFLWQQLVSSVLGISEARSQG